MKLFSALNPYDGATVPGSILKVETVNLGSDGRSRSLLAYVIAAKRYALFTVEPGRNLVVEDYKESGLGHLCNPSDLNWEDRNWMRQVWEQIVSEALKRPVTEPGWLERPALTRSTVSTPVLWRRLDGLGRNRPYADRIKPFNFHLVAHVAPLDRPTRLDGKAFQLIAPYSSDPASWIKARWIDCHSGGQFRIAAAGSGSSRVRARTYGSVLVAYRLHREAKSSAPDGSPCSLTTRGLLARRPVHALTLSYIGKEANRLEEQATGLVHDMDEVQTVYRDSLSAAGCTLRVLVRGIPSTRLAALSGLPASTIRSLRSGRVEPRPGTLAALVRALEHLSRPGSGPGRFGR